MQYYFSFIKLCVFPWQISKYSGLQKKKEKFYYMVIYSYFWNWLAYY